MAKRNATMKATIRPAGLADVAAIAALLPELASFDIPKGRTPKDLWAGDLDNLHDWAAGKKPQCMVSVAHSGDEILGFTIVSLRAELLSGEPSAHLEAIVVAQAARGTGVGRALLNHVEANAKAQGARSITLHVFGNNTNARAVYRNQGYDEELIRASKLL